MFSKLFSLITQSRRILAETCACRRNAKETQLNAKSQHVRIILTNIRFAESPVPIRTFIMTLVLVGV